MSAVRDRLGLTWKGLLALTAASIAMAASALVLIAVSEDVIGRDGLALRDGANLRFFSSQVGRLWLSLHRVLTSTRPTTHRVVARA